MIRAAFFDIDGTLVPFSADGPSMRTIAALSQLHERGIEVILATGRRKGFIGHVLEKLEAPVDGLITANGQICSVHGLRVRERHLDTDDALVAMRYLREESIYTVVAEAEGSFELMPASSCKWVLDYGTTLWPAYDETRVACHGIVQLIAHLPQDEPQLERELESRLSHAKIARWHPRGVDVIPSDGGKGRGVQAIARALGLSRDELVAFGDGQNDLEMFAEVGTSVAMGDGDERLKSVATMVAEPAELDGVACALAELGLVTLP